MIELPSPPHRPDYRVAPREVAICLNAGGIGDYINWIQAIHYAIDKNPHIHGWIVAPDYFEDLAGLWFKRHAPRFKVISQIYCKENLAGQDIALILPDKKQFANALGFNLFNLGFIFYNQINFIRHGYDQLPVITGDETDISHFRLPERYAVVTTMATQKNRRLHAGAVNQFANWLLTEGITPVFIGSSVMAHDHKAASDEGIKFDNGIDLRDQTNLIEAACIMARAKLVAGLDNGMLHLASCSMVPVVFGFTIAGPKHRLPPRQSDARTVALTPPATLACRYCQSNMRYLIGHDFKNCLYGDTACTEHINGNLLIEGAKMLLSPPPLQGSES